jgi:signal transduction histidine kinase
MRSSWSLRARFIAALMLVVMLLSAGFGYAVYRFVEVLETELMDGFVRQELREFAQAFQQAPQLPVPHAPGLQGYIVHPGEPPPSTLAAALLTWPAGHYGDFESNGKEFFGGREDVGAVKLYLVQDIAKIEALENRFTQLAYLFILCGLLASALVGTLLARLVTRPVSNLAEQVALLEPSGARVSLRAQFGDREIGQIAAAFDRYQEHVAHFVQRERAFSDDASHELRTPLSIVLSAAQLLREEPGLSARGHERLARITRAAEQMRQLVEALLLLAREDGGQAREPCALDQLLGEVAEHSREALAGKDLSLHCEIAQPLTIMAPPGMALCVISNLVGNALQHTRKGRVDLRLERDRLVVQDTGAGIAAADLERLFERRYRGAHSSGLGLGLHIVKRICDQLGWRIEVSSAPGTGTRFDLIFAAAI